MKEGFQVTNYLDGVIQQTDSQTIIGGGLQPETQIWYARILKNGGSISNADIATTDILMYQLNQASYRSKILFLLPFIGNVIKASIVPLIDDKCVGIPRNTGSTPFVDADCGTSLGLKATGSAGIVTGFLPPHANSTVYLGGLGVLIRNYDGTGGTTETWGCSNVTSSTFDGRYLLDLRTSGTNTFFCYGPVADRTTAGPVAASNHHYYGQRSASNLGSLWLDGAATGTNDTTTNTSLNTATTFTGGFALGCFADQGAGSYLYTKHTYGGAYVTDGTLASGDISALHTLLGTYLITATGR